METAPVSCITTHRHCVIFAVDSVNQIIYKYHFQVFLRKCNVHFILLTVWSGEDMNKRNNNKWFAWKYENDTPRQFNLIQFGFVILFLISFTVYIWNYDCVLPGCTVVLLCISYVNISVICLILYYNKTNKRHVVSLIIAELTVYFSFSNCTIIVCVVCGVVILWIGGCLLHSSYS